MRSTASRSLRMVGPCASQNSARMLPSVSTVSAMASPGAAQKVGDRRSRRRNEMADFGVEVNFGLRQQLFRTPLGVMGIDHRILAAEKNDDRHFESLQLLIALWRYGIAARVEVAEDEAKEITDRLGRRGQGGIGAAQHHRANPLSPPFAEEEQRKSLQE